MLSATPSRPNRPVSLRVCAVSGLANFSSLRRAYVNSETQFARGCQNPGTKPSQSLKATPDKRNKSRGPAISFQVAKQARQVVDFLKRFAPTNKGSDPKQAREAFLMAAELELIRQKEPMNQPACQRFPPMVATFYSNIREMTPSPNLNFGPCVS